MFTHVINRLRGSLSVLVIGLLTIYFADAMTGQRYLAPGPAEPIQPATHLALVTYLDGQDGGETTLAAYPLDVNGLPNITLPLPLFSRPDPHECEADSVHVSPGSSHIILQYNCEATLFVQFLSLDTQPIGLTALNAGYFLNWSPDGDWFLFRNVETDQVWLVPVDGGEWQLLDVPARTYNVSFRPDGGAVLYASSQGWGLGSELGLLNLVDSSLVTLQTFPDKVVAYPGWSPDGGHLAYVLMPDSNIPFTVGELWLADATNGEALTLLDSIDSGHGYPPVWSPDGSTIVYVRRENPDTVRADYDPAALRSNLYQVEVDTGSVTPLTYFLESLVYDPVWSPDGSQLAFTVNDVVWQLAPGQSPVQVSPAGVVRHPIWLSLTIP